MNNYLNSYNNSISKNDFIRKWVKDILQEYKKEIKPVIPPICEKALCKVIEDLRGIKIIIEPDRKISTFDEGFLVPIKGGFVIKYSTLKTEDKKFSDVRIRATICHELAHILFYDCKSLIPKLQTVSPEDWCHDIARYLLLPDDLVKESFLEINRVSSNSVDIIEKLSKKFQVSRMLIARRITEDLSLLKDMMVTFWKYKSEKGNSLNKQIHYRDYQKISKLSPMLGKLLPNYWRKLIHNEVWDKVLSKVAVGSAENLPKSLYVEGKRRNKGKIKSIPFEIEFEPLYIGFNNLIFGWKGDIRPISDILSVEKFDLNVLEDGK